MMLLFIALGITVLGYSQIWSYADSDAHISKVSDGVYSIMSGSMHYLYRRSEKKNDVEFNSKVQSWLDNEPPYKGSKAMYGEYGKYYRTNMGVCVLEGYYYLLWYDDIRMGLSVIKERYDPKKNKVIPDPYDSFYYFAQSRLVDFF